MTLMRNAIFGLVILLGIIMIWAPVFILGAATPVEPSLLGAATVAVMVLGGVLAFVGVTLLFSWGD